MKEFLKSNRKIVYVIAIFIAACIICSPLVLDNLNVYLDDGVQHIARAYGTNESLKYNKIFPNVIPSFTNGFGYSWNLFYGAFSTYGILLFYFLVKDFVVAYKLLVFLAMFLSGLFMYRLVYKMVKNYNAAVLAAILYMTFPYHLTDLYTRNALGEYLSFMFLPMIFIGLNNILFEKKDKCFSFALGAIGMVLTHNLSTLYTIILGIAYLIFNIEKFKDIKVVKTFAFSILLIVMCTSIFTIPLLEVTSKTNYMVYTDDMVTTAESAAEHGLRFKQLFVTNNVDGDYTFELGPHIIIILAFSVMAFPIINGRLRLQYGFMLFWGLISLWMSTKYFPWSFMPKYLTIIQFPWRMMMYVGFLFSIVCSINMYAIIKKFNYRDVLVIGLISIGYTAIFIPILPLSDGKLKDISDFNKIGVYSGSEFQDCVTGTAHGEYLPVQAYNDKFYIATREDNIYVLKGKALIENETKDGLNYFANINTYDAEYTIFELPYIYYPGYLVTYDGIELETFETENGFLGFALGSNDKGELQVKYDGSSIMKYSFVISFMGTMLLVFLIIYNIKQEKIDENKSKLKERLEK